MNKLIPALAMLLMASTAYGFECKVCHSKNPAMVRMHKALQGRNCFDCHKMGEKLMGKGIPKDKAAQLKRRESEQICFECHRPSPKASAGKPANQPKASAGKPANQPKASAGKPANQPKASAGKPANQPKASAGKPAT